MDVIMVGEKNNPLVKVQLGALEQSWAVALGDHCKIFGDWLV